MFVCMCVCVCLSCLNFRCQDLPILSTLTNSSSSSNSTAANTLDSSATCMLSSLLFSPLSTVDVHQEADANPHLFSFEFAASAHAKKPDPLPVPVCLHFFLYSMCSYVDNEKGPDICFCCRPLLQLQSNGKAKVTFLLQIVIVQCMHGVARKMCFP